MEFDPKIFKGVSLNTRQKTDASPAPPKGSWQGVIIVTPERVLLENEAVRPVIPVCGFFRVPVLEAMKGEEPLTLHLRAVGSKIVHSVKIAEKVENAPDEPDEPEVPPPADAPRPNPKEFEGVSTGGYFNIDAQHHLSVQLVPFVYEVWISYAGYKSEPVKVAIVAKPPKPRVPAPDDKQD